MKPATLNEQIEDWKHGLGQYAVDEGALIDSLIARVEEMEVELKRLHEMEATVQQVLAAPEDVEPLWPELVEAAKERCS